MTFSRLRTWLFFDNLFDYLIISTFSHTGMIIDGNVLVKMGIKPFFPIRQFLECLRIVFEGVNHDLSASLCGRVEGVERTTSRSRKWANFEYLSLRLFRGQRSHRYLSAKTDKRTSYNDFDWFQIRQNYGPLKAQVFNKETFAMVKLSKAMQLNTKGLEPMLNPLRRERGRDSKKLIRISIFDSYENETNCILPMMDPLFFYQRDTRPVGEMR